MILPVFSWKKSFFSSLSERSGFPVSVLEDSVFYYFKMFPIVDSTDTMKWHQYCPMQSRVIRVTIRHVLSRYYYSTKIIKRNFSKISQNVSLPKRSQFYMSRQEQSCFPPSLIFLLTTVALTEPKETPYISQTWCSLLWCIVLVYDYNLVLIFLLLILQIIPLSLSLWLPSLWDLQLPPSELKLRQITHCSLL